MTETTTTRRLRRSTTDRNLAGVAGGLGQYFGIDPVLIRVVLVLMVFAGGAGILVYLVAWVVLPEDDGSAAIASAPLSRDATTVAGVVILALAATILLNGWWWTGDLFLPLLLVGVGAWLLLRSGDEADDAAGETTESEERVPVTSAAATPTTATGAAPAVPPPPGGVAGVPAPPPPVPPEGPPTARITLGLVALVAGGFGIAHAAGAEPSIEAVLLTCLAVTAAGLLVGAFTGRARGLIVLAVPLVLALSVVSAVDIPLAAGMGDRRYDPATLAELDDTYELTAGALILDLRGLSADDLSSASGPTTVQIRLGFGEVTVFTPPDVTVRTDAEVSGGEIDLYGEIDEGAGVDARAERVAPDDDAPVLELLVDVGFGEVTVR